MMNHLHLLLQDAVGGNLPSAMHLLQGGYAQSWNRRQGRSGSIYERRYHAEPVQNDGHLLTASLYIHHNPKGAGMVRNAADYRWSSVGAYLGSACDIAIWSEPVMELCGDVSKYAALLAEYSEEDELLAPTIRGQSVIGSDVFQKVIEPQVERRTELRNMAKRPRECGLDEILTEAEARFKVTSSEICGQSRTRKVVRARAYLCAVGRREGISSTQMARMLNRTAYGVTELARLGEREIGSQL